MKLIFAEHAWEDYLFWLETDQNLLKRINALISEIQREPLAGIGKPEPLKHALAGFWTRRINHRIVYKIDDDALLLAQLRYCY